MGDRWMVVHGHFYQPPRENPWTETVPAEPSAAPYHDWNERITAECYRPNAFARIVDDQGLVVDVVDNYELLSFNLGPTLASWLELAHPDVYRRVVDADALSRTAIAQAYNHAILPLCNARDLRTQIRWGLADFEHRFGRRAAGIWLPETAVNTDVLAALAEEGVAFTILAPYQADQPVDPSIPYLWVHPDGSGRSVSLVFYDGGLSHDIAFGLAAQSAEVMVDRAERALDGRRGPLIAVATDGETFGHHHKFTERAVAYGLAVEAPRRSLRSGSLETFLAEHPPEVRVGVVESAWSCAHGIGRWRTDCGCATGGGPGWNQRWRAPLRAALDLLRDHAARVFERRGGKCLRDPWAARDAYIGVLLGARTIEDFAAEFVKRSGDLVEALTLLEVQRHTMAMYTSCGWFFNDLAGIETLICLRYAARAVDLLREIGDEPPETEFLRLLSTATSNDPHEGNGKDIWERHIQTTRVEPARVVSHLALLELLEQRAPGPVVGGYEVHLEALDRTSRGGLDLITGRVRLVHRRTRRETTHAYAAVSFGALEVAGAARAAGEAAVDDAQAVELARMVRSGARVASLLRAVVSAFGPYEFGLDSTLPGEEGQILATVGSQLADRFASSFERLLGDHRDTLGALALGGYPMPPELRAPFELVLARSFESDLASLAANGWDRLVAQSARQTITEARSIHCSLATPSVSQSAHHALRALVRRAITAHDSVATDGVTAFLALLREAGVHLVLDEVQDEVHAALRTVGEPLHALGRAVGLAVPITLTSRAGSLASPAPSR